MALIFENDMVLDNEPTENHGYDWDLLIIGGGSGGLALSQEAARITGKTKKIAVLDFVKPSPTGTSWGLGGTCVNVGCIPKKLMHHASLLGEETADAIAYGWELPEQKKHNWQKMLEGVQDHIGSLNWGYKTALREKGVEYINALGTFVDAHTVETINRAKKTAKITARRIVIAVGGRPKYLDIPGGEHCISSDDLFSLPEAPGKTLVVGASYVALECAGFLTGLGYDTTVMARSIFLRGFDQQIAEMIADYMKSHGTKFVRPAVPTKVEKLADTGKLRVFWNSPEDPSKEVSEEFDTVLVAVGRKADTAKLGLENAGVQYDSVDGKITVVHERTNIPHIYALGDVIKGDLELTPVAIKAGRMLAHRMFKQSTLQMDYTNIPTTVFTPLEYGACGYSEEKALTTFGAENVEVYHTYYAPLEFSVAHREDNVCYVKVICNKLDNERVVGIHILGPHAGEIMQGYAAAMKCGMTKFLLDQTVGIHPTSAEELTTLRITKSSGEEAKKKGC